MENAYLKLLQDIGEDPTREGLQKTPARAAKAMRFLTSGYELNLKQIANDALFESPSTNMVVLRHVELYSICEHHLLPFTGHCHIGYIPNGKVLGISKFARIVDMYARRLQIQENLGQQIAEAIAEITNAQGVGVVIEAKHFCMMMRGVEKQHSVMSTAAMLGSFSSDRDTRQEFLHLIQAATIK